MEKHYDRICASIDLDAINHNIEVIHKTLNPGTKILAVIKTDGYGHGAVPIARELEKKEFIFGFATATAEEALILRKAGIELPILVLGYVFPYAYEELISENIHFTLFREDMMIELSREAVRQGKDAFVHVKVDTGMNRIGIFPNKDGLSFIKKLSECEGIQLEGIFTHFSKADHENKAHSYRQLEIFENFCVLAEEEIGMEIPLKHCANSAAALEIPDSHMNIVRAGISVYGLWPSEFIKKEAFDLIPAFSLHSHIVYIKTLTAGQEISYGGTFITERDTKVATIPVGYGDGYPRSLSNKGYVLIRGKRAPIIGKVCMDQFMVDVTDIEEVKEGDHVVLIGSSKNEIITMEEIGNLADRFNYELTCVIGKRVPRIYFKRDKECYAKDYFNDYSFDKI